MEKTIDNDEYKKEYERTVHLMDGEIALKNWGYYDPPPMKHQHLNLQLMTSMAERKPGFGLRDSPLLGSSNGSGYHSRDYSIPSSESWINIDTTTTNNSNSNSNRFLNIMPTNHNYGFPMETPLNHHHPHHHSMQMIRQPDSSNEEQLDRMVRAKPVIGEMNNSPLKKRSAPKSDKGPKMKKPKKSPVGSAQRSKVAKKTAEVVINGIDMDISSIPIPVCSCTGSPQQCYRWGFGGWQSACCTTGMSMYPLPMSAKRRGARIAGRKMSLGAFKKVLEKLAGEGFNFSNPIDLRTHWAKHGTNKFVTIK